jgi:DNA mismatch endonuclease (patch repair protein)
VHGCFWHQHPGCRLASWPKSRPEYWAPKLRRNVERDAAAAKALKALGWRCFVIWECDTRSPARFASQLDELERALKTIPAQGHETVDGNS